MDKNKKQGIWIVSIIAVCFVIGLVIGLVSMNWDKIFAPKTVTAQDAGDVCIVMLPISPGHYAPVIVADVSTTTSDGSSIDGCGPNQMLFTLPFKRIR